jgi:hypothetical protein
VRPLLLTAIVTLAITSACKRGEAAGSDTDATADESDQRTMPPTELFPGVTLRADELEVVQRERLVPRDDDQPFDLRLRDQHAVEGIAMM